MRDLPISTCFPGESLHCRYVSMCATCQGDLACTGLLNSIFGHAKGSPAWLEAGKSACFVALRVHKQGRSRKRFVAIGSCFHSGFEHITQRIKASS